MALQIAFNRDSTGDEYPEAYRRVIGINLQMAPLRGSGGGLGNGEIYVATYRNVQARQEEKQPVEVTLYRLTEENYASVFGLKSLNVSEANPAKRAYEYLKSLPEYAGASNV